MGLFEARNQLFEITDTNLNLFQSNQPLNFYWARIRQCSVFSSTKFIWLCTGQLEFTLFRRYGPAEGLFQFNNNIVSKMMKGQYLVFLVVIFVLGTQAAPISLDFNAFDASYSQDQKLRLSFRCTGGSGVYSFEFRNIPAEWKVSGNTITIERFSINTRQNWRFSIYVTDTQNNYLSQNLMLNFMGAYIGLTSITLPVTGQLANNFNDYYSPFSIASQLNQQTAQQPAQSTQPAAQPTQPVQSPQPKPTTQPTVQQSASPTTNSRLGDLVNGYPGADAVDKLTTGFGVPTDSPLAADLIASSKAVYNPLRDSASAPSPFKDQKDQAIKRQSQANQTLESLNSVIGRLSSTLGKLKEDARVAEIDTNSSRANVNDCDQQLFSLEDTKTKILNAIKDKESTLNQYNAEIGKQDKVTQAEVQKLNNLEDLKKKTESDTLPSSRALQNLQRTLDQCRSNLLKNSKQSQQIKIDLEKTQTEIKMLNIQSNEARSKVEKANSDLTAVREKIKSLTDQLKEAQLYEATILNDKNKNEQIPKRNDKRVAELQIKLNNITSSSSAIRNSEDCKVYEAPIITVQNIISKDRERYNQVLSQVQAQKLVVEKAKNSSSDLKKVVSSLPLQIATLKNQISTYDVSINRTSYLCDDKITEYSKNAVSLQSINEKIDSSQADLARLYNQLVSAQTQFSLATNSLNDIIKNEAAYINRVPGVATSTSASTSQPKVSTPTPTTTSTTPSSTPNPNISIDQIVNNAIRQRAASAGSSPSSSASSSSTTVSTPSGTTGSVTTQNTVTQPQSSQFQTTSFASASGGDDSNQFSIASFLSRSSDQFSSPGQSTQTSQTAASSTTSPPAPTSTPVPPPVTRNPLNQNFDTIIGQQFKASSKAGFKSVNVGDARQFLKKANINIGNANMIQNTNLYTLDSASLQSLIVRGNNQATLPLLTCSTPTLVDSALIQDIGLGYILAKNNDTLFRLSFSSCTKILSTYTSGSLKQGTRIYFTGIPVVSIPNNVLLNASLVVCNPDSP